MSKATEGNNKKALVPKLRFPEYAASKAWPTDSLKNLMLTVAPPKKLLSSTYKRTGRFPIVDQSKDYICGWTDDESAAITDGLPLLVFGDHTCELKIVNEPFAQGADGIKILRAGKRITAPFLYQYLLHSPVVMTSYRRHYTILKEKVIPLPDLESGEQQKIADCLSSLDALIAAHTDKLAALKTHKQGLLQQLFPKGGETVPRLRFPAFRNAGQWKQSRLLELAEGGLSNGVFNDPDKAGRGYKLINVSDMYAETTIKDEGLSLVGLTEQDFLRNKVEQGDLFFTRSSLVKKGIAKSNIYLGSAPDVTFDGHLVKLTPNRKIVFPIFLHYVLHTSSVRSQLVAKGKTATMTTIGQLDIASTVACVPHDDEQQKIADCLSSLDTFITAQADKIAALKQHKQGLLQQLFPAMDEAIA